jgi:hypothetical protein
VRWGSGWSWRGGVLLWCHAGSCGEGAEGRGGPGRLVFPGHRRVRWGGGGSASPLFWAVGSLLGGVGFFNGAGVGLVGGAFRC